MLRAESLTLRQGSQVISRSLSLDFARGGITALVGPNGAGKTTLLRALQGGHRPSGGRITLDGLALTDAGRRRWQARIGYMPQESRASDGVTVLEAVLLGRAGTLAFHLPDAELRAAATLLQEFGLLELAGRSLATLSGGQRQLVFFAQCLAREPEVMLLDEPVSALDLRHQQTLMRALRRLTDARQLISVVVLHDLNLAARYADRIAVLAEGRLRAIGPPREALSAPLLSEIYGVTVRVLRDADNMPLVQSLV
ncbi:ABC transporter ATP-binding protein [Teichococcus vastitatis]|jgi:iron complex transport system ATP-binding protein|uniref:ABC transporter ATP-binding protein n=1 Tax=Teichococcus vastitatis TaxID=2307076 RepID=UPI000E742ECD|nr:ABC transporter ATP-binding protein [Pseudoroseomonas vastitatis]